VVFPFSAVEAGFAFLKNSRAFAEKPFACDRIAISTETAKEFGLSDAIARRRMRMRVDGSAAARALPDW